MFDLSFGARYTSYIGAANALLVPGKVQHKLRTSHYTCSLMAQFPIYRAVAAYQG
jgi:hypothetical protein